MGSLFSPSVPRYAPVTYTPPAAVTQTVTELEDEDKVTENQSEEESVRDFIRRTNRGRNSLIQTGYRGVLTDLNTLAPKRKNLLGE